MTLSDKITVYLFFVRVIMFAILVANADAYSDTDYASDIVRLTNSLREERGLPVLDVDDCLTRSAIVKARDVAEREYVGLHAYPGEQFDRFVACAWSDLGENIAWYYQMPDLAFSAFVNSTPHLDVMMCQYEKIGVGTWNKDGWPVTVMYLSN